MEWQSKRRPAEPVSAALFDFDGTISVLRCGWENVMESFMVELIEGSAGCAESAEHTEHTGRTGRAESAGRAGGAGAGWESGGGPGGASEGDSSGGPGTGPGGGVRDMVRRYIDESAGIQTIFQMKWLAEQVQARGAAKAGGSAAKTGAVAANCSAAAALAGAATNGAGGNRGGNFGPRCGDGRGIGLPAGLACSAAAASAGAAATAAPACGPWGYKAEYNRRLMVSVAERRRRLRDGVARPEEYMIRGSRELLEMLAGRGVALYVASGTDDADVKREVAALGLAGFFSEIRGAPEGREDCSKEAAIRELLGDKGVAGSRLAVVGDGRVEIAIGRENGARTLGVASDERALAGVNPVKRARLLKAGADAVAGDFGDAAALGEFFFGKGWA
jgi:phosphoglycolate phosphatase-like HAD superfamily hydrolase